MRTKYSNSITSENIFTQDNVVNINGLHRQNAPYIFIWVLYYAWVVAFATWWTSSPVTEDIFNMQLRSLMHSVNLVSSVIFILILRKEWFIKASRIGAAVIITGMSVFFTVPDAHIHILSAIISSIAIGCVNICILFPFVFTLNNTEKLYAVVTSNALIQLISLLQGFSTGVELILSFAILVAALSTTLFFKKNVIANDTDDQKTSTPELPPRVYLTIFFNCAIAVLCKGAGKGILNIAEVHSKMPVLMWYYIGGLIGCFLFILIYAFSKKAFILVGNITFSSVAMGLLCNAFAEQVPRFAAVFGILLGIGSTVGMINMYYIIGVVGKKYNSIRYLRLSILLIGICGGVSGIVVGYYISIVGTFEISVIASVISAAVMTMFMIASPIMAQSKYENDWGRDSRNTDINNEQLYIFNKYQLSKREIEVCKLLLQGYTMRQISGILSITYSTVNTYCTSLYRKLGINSRTELLLLFKDYALK